MGRELGGKSEKMLRRCYSAGDSLALHRSGAAVGPIGGRRGQSSFSPAEPRAPACFVTDHRQLTAWTPLVAMGKYNLTALRVRQTAINQRAAGKFANLPAWVHAVADIPPAQVLVRTQPQQHQLVRQRVKTVPGSAQPQVVLETQEKPRKPKKASRLFQPVQIKYEEDELRREFFRDHPWELARPRVLVETSGNDFTRHNWQQLQQPGRKLDGERYVNGCRPS